MRQIALVALTFGIVLVALTAGTAQAQQGCYATAFRQDDMAGVYISPEVLMRVEIYPCGGSVVEWDNVYGRHAAAYSGRVRLAGGGIGARGMTPDPIVGYLDNTTTLGFKPADPGYIQVITVSPYGDVMGIYRLQKLT
jgi:hypothetical protein